MLYEIKKALEALHRPGIDSSVLGLARNALPYYLPFIGKVPPPLTLYWSINSVCNLRCKMCDVGMFNEEGMFFKTLRIDRKLHEIDISVFKRVIDEVAAAKPFIAINSTEPLLYKPLAEAVAYCTARGLRTGVTTGGYSLPARAEELAEAGLTRLAISIDGPPDIHNHIRGRADSFEHSYEGIERFMSACQARGRTPEIYLNCTITNMNYARLVDFYQAVEKLPATTINFTYMWFIDPVIAEEHNMLYGERFPVTASCYSEWVDPAQVDVDVLADQIDQIKGKPRVNVSPMLDRDRLYRYFHDRSSFVNPAGRCLASWFFLQILADGSVIVYTRCHNQPVGNINHQSVAEIWNGPAMQQWRAFIRKAGKMPMCKRCDVVY
jgi:MoaA/NifB/PqqE/SkfB family radical SAM enzyme